MLKLKKAFETKEPFSVRGWKIWNKQNNKLKKHWFKQKKKKKIKLFTDKRKTITLKFFSQDATASSTNKESINNKIYSKLVSLLKGLCNICECILNSVV